MRWRRTGRQSSDVIDRRGSGRVSRGAKIGIPAVLATLVAIIFGANVIGGDGSQFEDILGQLSGQAPAAEANAPPTSDPDAELAEFMGFVLDDVQATWDDIFTEAGQAYPRAQLVLFSQATESSCGGATSAIGPHYCSIDNRVYIDLDFFEQLERDFGAPGDFAQAYVLAHEIGHHVQNVVGISGAVRREQQANPGAANDLSVRLELQADCFAGVWAHSAFELLEPGDLQEGLEAAAAVGDDRIQAAATGYINPESWTHGSSEQRMEWFQRGYDSGDPNDCNTF